MDHTGKSGTRVPHPQSSLPRRGTQRMTPPRPFTSGRPPLRDGRRGGGRAACSTFLFLFLFVFYFVTDRSLAVATNGMHSLFRRHLPFAQLRMASPFCPRCVSQVSQSESLIHGRCELEPVRSAAVDRTEWCFPSSTTNKMGVGGKWRSGRSPGSPLAHVLTFPTTVGDRKERNVSQTYFHSFISFRLGNLTSQRTECQPDYCHSFISFRSTT